MVILTRDRLCLKIILVINIIFTVLHLVLSCLGFSYFWYHHGIIQKAVSCAIAGFIPERVPHPDHPSPSSGPVISSIHASTPRPADCLTGQNQAAPGGTVYNMFRRHAGARITLQRVHFHGPSLSFSAIRLAEAGYGQAFGPAVPELCCMSLW